MEAFRKADLIVLLHLHTLLLSGVSLLPTLSSFIPKFFHRPGIFNLEMAWSPPPLPFLSQSPYFFNAVGHFVRFTACTFYDSPDKRLLGEISLYEIWKHLVQDCIDFHAFRKSCKYGFSLETAWLCIFQSFNIVSHHFFKGLCLSKVFLS